MVKSNTDKLANRTPSETSIPYGVPVANSSGEIDSSWINLQSGGSVLSSDYTITADDTWQNTGLSVSLPAAGTYFLFANISGHGRLTAGTAVRSIKARLFDVTGNAAVTNTPRRVAYVGQLSVAIITSASIAVPFTVTVASTIRLEGWRDSGSTWGDSQIMSNSVAWTNLSWLRIA